jgi:transmembrane sensor
VAKRPDWPFIVKAGNRRVTALGTSFVVRYDEQLTAVTLVEGKVSITPERPPTGGSRQSAPADTFTLYPGQRLTFTGPQAQLDAPSMERAVAWRQGLVVLDDTPLASAVAEMNRYNGTKLVIERPETGTLVVNGLFQTGDSLSFARAVAQTYGLHVIERHDTIVLAGVPAASSSR